jgi:hypothetical protein
MLEALKWLEDHAPASTLNALAYAQASSLRKTPIGTLTTMETTSSLNGIRRHY